MPTNTFSSEMVCLVKCALNKCLQNLESAMNSAIHCIDDLESIAPWLLFLPIFILIIYTVTFRNSAVSYFPASWVRPLVCHLSLCIQISKTHANMSLRFLYLFAPSQLLGFLFLPCVLSCFKRCSGIRHSSIRTMFLISWKDVCHTSQACVIALVCHILWCLKDILWWLSWIRICFQNWISQSLSQSTSN